MHKDLSSLRMKKTETESRNWGRIYLNHEVIGDGAFLFGIQLTD